MDPENNNTNNIETDQSGDQSNPLMDAIKGRLLDESGSVSSNKSTIQRTISDAVKSVRRGGNAAEGRIQSDFRAEQRFLTGQGDRAAQSALEQRGGYGTQMAALRGLTERTDKTLRDLDQRRQQALQENDAETAQQINSLLVQELEFMQQAEQNTFQNLIAAAGVEQANERNRLEKQRVEISRNAQEFTETIQNRRLDQEARGLDLREQAQDFTESAKVAEVAMSYGLEINEGETIDSIVSRAKPFASEERQLELERMRAEIQTAKARTAEAMAGADLKSQSLSDTDVLSMAQAYRTMPEGSELLRSLSTNDQAAVIRAVNEMEKEDSEELMTIASGYDDPEQFMEDIENSSKAYPQNLVERAQRSIIVPENPGLVREGANALLNVFRSPGREITNISDAVKRGIEERNTPGAGRGAGGGGGGSI